LADALIRQGEYDATPADARDGLSTKEEAGHRQWEAELYRVEGVALSGLNRLENTIQHASTQSNSVRKTLKRGSAEHAGSSW
jgi:hypothetical protein